MVAGLLAATRTKRLGLDKAAVKAMAGVLDLGTNPFVSPAHKIGGKHGQHRLNANTGGLRLITCWTLKVVFSSLLPASMVWRPL